jgi:TonB family protein
MKKAILLALLSAGASCAIGQNSKIDRPVASTAFLQKENLVGTQSVNDVLMSMYRYPDYVQEWTAQLKYLLVEVVGICEGKERRSVAKGGVFSADQTEIFSKSDVGRLLKINVEYMELVSSINPSSDPNEVKRMRLHITVRPAVEAMYPGGYAEMVTYLRNSVYAGLGNESDPADEIKTKVEQSAVTFIVNEEGTVTDAKIERSSSNDDIDRLILDAVKKMPKWSPAAAASGIKVKEVLSVSLTTRAGC